MVHNFTSKTIFLALLIVSCSSEPPPKPENKWPPKPIVQPHKPPRTPVNKDDAALIGKKIWMNEGFGKVEKLTVWKKGENFASLGIGHFPWHPRGGKPIPRGTFPQFVAFLQHQGIKVPFWLQKNHNCPWKSRKEFYQNRKTARMVYLRNLLKNTIPQQVQFLLMRLEQALPKYMHRQFDRIAQTPIGIYALIDYVIFNGLGTAPKDCYNNQCWGLLQVLKNMPNKSDDIIVEFVQTANKLLERRVQNAPRDESYLLQGWRYRLKTYTFIDG